MLPERRIRQDDSVAAVSGFVPRDEVRAMLDLFYILIGVLFFVGCYAFVKACDRL